MEMNRVCSQRRRRSSPEGSTAPSGPFGPSAEPRCSSARRPGQRSSIRRERVYRLCRLLGSDDPRPQPPGGRRGHPGSGRPGTSYGAPTEFEIGMAERLVAAFPSIEMVRMVSSGTEATMTAIRLARGFTGREKIIKFTGCYHGHADSLLVKAGSGVATLGIPGKPGHSPVAGRADDLRCLTTTPRRSGAPSAASARSSPASSSNRWPATWGSCRPGPDSWKPCGR